jgi:hypothetical protein
MLPLGRSARWTLGTNVAFALQLRKVMENVDGVGRYTGRSGCKLTSKQQSGIQTNKH